MSSGPIDRLRTLSFMAIYLGDDGAWLAQAVRSYLDGAAEGMTLDEAFGVACAPGERPWYQVEAKERRYELIRQLAAAIGHDPAAIAARLGRYAPVGFRHDRMAARPPTDQVRRLMFEILKLDSNAPSLRTVQRALAPRGQ